MKNQKTDEMMVEIFCKYITIKGKRVYPKNGKCFHFFVKPKQ